MSLKGITNTLNCVLSENQEVVNNLKKICSSTGACPWSLRIQLPLAFCKRCCVIKMFQWRLLCWCN